VLLFAVCVFTRNYYYSAFMLGVFLNFTADFKAILNSTRFRNLVLVTMLLTGLVLGGFPSNGSVKGSFFAFADHPAFISLESLIHVIGAFLTVMVVQLSSRLQQFFSLKLFEFLGFISFSLYLVHALVLGSFSCFLFLQFHQVLGYNLAVVATLIPSLLLIVWFSYLMAHYVDQKSVTVSKAIYSKWFANKPTPSKTNVPA
jgi:peptidoglycan/LPS O-acetylase OafA/YrhL